MRSGGGGGSGWRRVLLVRCVCVCIRCVCVCIRCVCVCIRCVCVCSRVADAACADAAYAFACAACLRGGTARSACNDVALGAGLAAYAFAYAAYTLLRMRTLRMRLHTLPTHCCVCGRCACVRIRSAAYAFGSRPCCLHTAMHT
jgi:hypothetical protein